METNLDEKMHTNKEFPPLKLMPEREWLFAKIIEVKYEFAQFQGKPQYATDKEGNEITDKDGNKIQRRIFNLTFAMRDFQLDNGNPRKAWLKLGASLSPKAKLTTFLENLEIVLMPEATPRDLVNLLLEKEVKLQLANKKSSDGTKTYQNVVFDAVKNI